VVQKIPHKRQYTGVGDECWAAKGQFGSPDKNLPVPDTVLVQGPQRLHLDLHKRPEVYEVSRDLMK